MRGYKRSISEEIKQIDRKKTTKKIAELRNVGVSVILRLEAILISTAIVGGETEYRRESEWQREIEEGSNLTDRDSTEEFKFVCCSLLVGFTCLGFAGAVWWYVAGQ